MQKRFARSTEWAQWVLGFRLTVWVSGGEKRIAHSFNVRCSLCMSFVLLHVVRSTHESQECQWVNCKRLGWIHISDLKLTQLNGTSHFSNSKDWYHKLAKRKHKNNKKIEKWFFVERISKYVLFSCSHIMSICSSKVVQDFFVSFQVDQCFMVRSLCKWMYACVWDEHNYQH